MEHDLGDSGNSKMAGTTTNLYDQDVVIKETKPVRLAEIRGVAAALAPEHIGPVFLAVSPKLVEHLRQARAVPGTLIHYYDEPAQDASVGVHVGYEIGQQPVPGRDGIEIVELPPIQVASMVHRGGMEGIVAAYEALIAWIGENGYRRAGYSRELYHARVLTDPALPSCKYRAQAEHQACRSDRPATVALPPDRMPG